MTTAPLDVRPDNLWRVKTTLRKHVPEGVKVYAFGSRAKWTAKEFSDLDICLKGSERLPSKVINAIAEELEDSDLPYKVDVIDWHAISSSFQQAIEKDLAEIDLAEWDVLRLADYCVSVRDGTHDSPKPVDNGQLLITSRHIIGGRIDVSKAYQISQSDFDAINKRSQVDQWDVLISMIGTVGEVCLVSEKPNFAIKNIGLFKTGGEQIGRWIYNYLRSADGQNKIKERLAGTTQAYISLGALRDFPIPVAPEAEIIAINNILGTLDDKIDLNRRMNETLEAMARAIFKDWFVDFGPTRAKMEGRAPYLAPDLWELFPDRLGDDGLPVGWEMGTFGTVARIRGEPINPNNVNSDTPYIGLEHMPRQSISLSDWGHAEKVSSNKLQFYKGDILFGKLRPYFHKVGVAPMDGICSTDIVVCSSKRNEDFGFVLMHVSSEEFVAFTNQASTGTKMPRTSWSIMASYPTVLPSKELREIFGKTTKSFVSEMLANIYESKSLSQTRDMLLPKLMTGEVRVNGEVTA